MRINRTPIIGVARRANNQRGEEENIGRTIPLPREEGHREK